MRSWNARLRMLGHCGFPAVARAWSGGRQCGYRRGNRARRSGQTETIMSSRWQTVQVFISSTFRDMQAERDHLVKVVFPALREKLLRHRVHLVDIDLRWGVT